MTLRNSPLAIDGARIEFKDGWGLLRASNTQPVIVARFEARSEARLQEIRDEISSIRNELPPEMEEPVLTRFDPSEEPVITMTLTSPTCGMGQVLANDVRYRLSKVPHVDEVIVNIVFDPPWNRDNLSDEAKLELGIF